MSGDETTRLRALLERTAARVLTVAEERNAATERAERAEHKHATVLASLTHALAQGDALNAEAKDMHDRMTAAEVRAGAAERERDDLAATLETRTAAHALAMARVAELEARLTAARKATEDLPRHLGATWWGQQLRAALVEPTAEVSHG